MGITDGIIITISQGMLKEKGYRNWLRNFLGSMEQNAAGEDIYYWMRVGAEPKRDNTLLYVYLCIGGKIRYRAFYAGSRPGGRKTFGNPDGSFKSIEARAWVLLAGPVEKAPYTIKKQGTQGFRYTEKLF